MNKALGLIEVIGYVGAIEAADSASKAANIKLIGVQKVGAGIVTVFITGDVGAVKASIDAAKDAVERVGVLRHIHVIPRPHHELDAILTKTRHKTRGNQRMSLEIANGSAQGTEEVTDNTIQATENNKLEKEPKDESQIATTDTKEQIETSISVEPTEVKSVTHKVEAHEQDSHDKDDKKKPMAGEPTGSMDTERAKDQETSNEAIKAVKRPVVEKSKLMERTKGELQNMILTLGIPMSQSSLKSTRKEELANIIIKFYKEGDES